MVKRIKILFSEREIIKNIIVKELKARYAGSLLGISWTVITPLLITAVISFVFTKVIKTDIGYFPLFVLSAILRWMCFSSSLFDAAPSIIRNSHILNQFTISKEILPVASVTANFINFIFGLLAMLPIFIIFKIKMTTLLFLLPFVILFHFIFTVGISLLLSCINIFLRDITHLLEVGLMFWFWITPVFYSVDMIPVSFRWVCILNPMTSYITVYRSILFEARLPGFYPIIIAVFMSLFMLIIGYATFIKFEPEFFKKI